MSSNISQAPTVNGSPVNLNQATVVTPTEKVESMIPNKDAKRPRNSSNENPNPPKVKFRWVMGTRGWKECTLTGMLGALILLAINFAARRVYYEGGTYPSATKLPGATGHGWFSNWNGLQTDKQSRAEPIWPWFVGAPYLEIKVPFENHMVLHLIKWNKSVVTYRATVNAADWVEVP